ncbi:glycosyl hydrolase [Bifidobacterium sp. ESL0728]|uniref:glycoside hydrolase 5 family protein n=1 Tax=Bifidobacterium sp. ESL0728 TaxID=2983220 RepID=UPI0023F97176|nr:glycosyl hydrolase [Bifidobacterium sp. ESL0728]WEV58520.1 glycosyl hydrolase [Bifidobacterium sp. ESL0728]
MRFGVNYTPSHGWFHSWLHPDWDSTKRDLDAIAELGMDHVRLFPLWPVLQPNRTWINQDGIEDVRHMASLASERGLDVYSDVLQGHLSSFDFVPSWLVSWHENSMFSDPQAVEAQSELVSALYDALSTVPRFKGLNIGNECNQFADRIHPRRMNATSEDAQAWLHALLDPIEKKAHANGHVLLHSENDAVWYEDGHPFEPRQASGIGDITAIHSWIFNGTAQKYGAMSETGTRHAEYLAELSKAFADDPHHPVWLQEIGAPQNVIDVQDTPRFCAKTVEHAMDCTDLYGVTWWCSHDVTSAMSDFPPFEHDLGLFDENGKLKPIGEEYARLARQYHSRREPPVRSTAVVVQCNDAGNPTLRAACAPGGSVFEKWMSLSSQGKRPALVTSQTANDAGMLEELGINECVKVPMTAGDAYSAVSDPSLEDAVAAQ